MNNIQIFKSPMFGQIRVSGSDEQPMFCLADVCSILDIKNISDCKSRLSPKGVVTNDTPTNGGVQQMIFINESNLYKVIFQSRKTEAELFQEWVTSEILPSIRKHGVYMTSEVIEKTLSDPDFLIKLATELKKEKERNRLLEKTNEENIRFLEQQAPKVLFADAVATSNKSILVGEMAKLMRQNKVEIGERRLFQWMRDNHFLCSYGERYNQPTQEAMERGLFEIKKTTITKPDGIIIVSTTPKVTGKGQIYFLNKFLKTGSANRETPNLNCYG